MLIFLKNGIVYVVIILFSVENLMVIIGHLNSYIYIYIVSRDKNVWQHMIPKLYTVLAKLNIDQRKNNPV